MFSRTCAGYFHLARTASILQFSGRGGGKISIAISRGNNDHVQIIVCRVSLEVHPSLHGNNGIRVWGSPLRCWPIEPCLSERSGTSTEEAARFVGLVWALPFSLQWEQTCTMHMLPRPRPPLPQSGTASRAVLSVWPCWPDVDVGYQPWYQRMRQWIVRNPKKLKRMETLLSFFFLQCSLTLTIDGRCLWVFVGVCVRGVCVRGVCVLRAELRVCIEVPCAFCLCFFFLFHNLSLLSLFTFFFSYIVTDLPTDSDGVHM